MSKIATKRKKQLGLLPQTFSYSEARQAGFSDWTLTQIYESGLLERLGRGRYSKIDGSTIDPDLLAIAGRHPLATICLRSALAKHGLTDEIPNRIDIALPAGTRPPALHIPIAWHRFDKNTFMLGREEMDLGGHFSIGLYSAERSIIDAFRLRRFEGYELGLDALRRWLAMSGSQPARLLEMSKKFPKTSGPLLTTLRILT